MSSDRELKATIKSDFYTNKQLLSWLLILVSKPPIVSNRTPAVVGTGHMETSDFSSGQSRSQKYTVRGEVELHYVAQTD